MSNTNHTEACPLTNRGFRSPTAVTGPVVGVVGGGQLARMMGPAATELGIELRVLAEADDSCAITSAAQHQVGDYRDLSTLMSFAQGVDVVTFDHEHVPTEHLQALMHQGITVHPQPSALVHAQDKIVMRQAVETMGLPNPRWAEVATPDELIAFAKGLWPVILKTPRGGYDGKGVALVSSEQEVRQGDVAQWFDSQKYETLLAEEAIKFTRELSVMVARNASGEIRSWPVVESIQRNSVCDEVIAPAPSLPPVTAQKATEAACALAEQLQVTGVMAVELFETTHGEIFINELAMRPHNSGHWSMDGSVTSQFEQHLRAILDLPLGATDPVATFTVMKNILGGSSQDLFQGFTAAMTLAPEAKIHLYGKSVRQGRKVGHLNLTTTTIDELDALRTRATQVAEVIREGRVALPEHA